MKLFHGTNTIIEKPRILIPNRALDFGAGFYLTSDFTQAARWAKLVVLRTGGGVPLVHEYCFDRDNLNELKVKRFESVSKEWLDFVCDHRLDIYKGDDFDLVIGPVANDRTMRVVQAYMGATDRDLYAPVALNDIRADKLSDQYVFRSERALDALRLLDVREV
jgi:hypothetical protein